MHDTLREGFQKKTANYPLFLDKGVGFLKVDKRWGGQRGWMKKFLNMNIINFKKVKKPRGGGRTKWIMIFLLNLGTFKKEKINKFNFDKSV